MVCMRSGMYDGGVLDECVCGVEVNVVMVSVVELSNAFLGVKVVVFVVL